MPGPSEVELFYTLQALEVRYWDEVDARYGREAHLFYAPDCVFTIADRRFEGRDAVRDFYGWRAARGERTARHIVTNARLDADQPTRPVLRWIMFLYAADGAPVLPSLPAIMVADCETVFTQAPDGGWLVAVRTLSPVFTGGVAPTLPPDPPSP